MTERRHAARKRRRFLVSFDVDGRVATGFTRDVSSSGLFVASASLPRIGQEIKLEIHQNDGTLLRCLGRVVRARKTHPALASTNPTGFCVHLHEPTAEYHKLVGD
ncbi:MAG: PilZ domain-containing protein [Acidobacteria bacterium]|nr:PilZ domain-containing protein [Acidobacteriota bacterium]MCK6685702.1 PilZ domain-containing protein [Thermoanaerobaculia bacterium]